jgi:plasmid maintenance system antidote protein VapI
MKKVIIVIFIAAAVACAGYWISYRCATATAESMLTKPGGEMEWLKREYHLSDAEFARIQQLHREYAPRCDLMCEKIAQANDKLDQLVSTNRAVTPEVAAALKECLGAQAECREALLGHVYAVSAEMSPQDGARYLQMMKARIVEPGLSHNVVISESSK